MISPVIMSRASAAWSSDTFLAFSKSLKMFSSKAAISSAVCSRKGMKPDAMQVCMITQFS